MTTISFLSTGPLRVPLREAARGIELILELMARLAAAAAVAVATTTEEFLPPAEGEPHPHGPPVNPGKRVMVPERLRFLEEMGPVRVVSGVRQGGGAPYIAFIFPNVVLLECEAERNALYLFDGASSWADLAKMPKLELIRQRPQGFLGRICHKGDWQGRARARVSAN